MHRSWTDITGEFHDREGGAVVLLMVAGAMVILLFSLTLYDASRSIKDKMTAQSAADMAAYSHAAIEARSMNMMAYANIGKRSIFSMHATYISAFVSYGQIAGAITFVTSIICKYAPIPTEDVCAMAQDGRQAIDRWRQEARQDFARLTGQHCAKPTTKSNETGGKGRQRRYTKKRCPSGVKDFEELIPRKGYGLDDLIDKLKEGSYTNPEKKIANAVLSTLTGNMSLTGFLQAIFQAIKDAILSTFLSFKELNPEQWGALTANYYAQDIKALDNYQRYLYAVTPWWAWVEHLVRAMRNGASTSTSYPLPSGVPEEAQEKIARAMTTSMEGGSSGSYVEMPGLDYVESLPVRPGLGPQSRTDPGHELTTRGKLDRDASEYYNPQNPKRDYMYRQLMKQLGGSLFKNITKPIEDAAKSAASDEKTDFDDALAAEFRSKVKNLPYLFEHFGNIAISILRSGMPKSKLLKFGFVAGLLIQTHDNMAARKDGALFVTQRAFDSILGPFTANPWVVRRYTSEGSWLAATSNLVMTYVNRGADDGRRRYGFLEGDYSYQSESDRMIYGANGYWGMARSEITYQGVRSSDQSTSGLPSLWQPIWSARMRPVALEGEFSSGLYSINDAYRESLAGLAMTSLLNVSSLSTLTSAAIDFDQMDRWTRAMGPATAEGVVR
jgi:hypothetical protein